MLADTSVRRATVSAQQASFEKIGREKARRHLLDFVQWTDPEYQRTRIHELIAEKLEAVERYIATKGKEGIGRLMIMMPPRHGKSELASRKFPAWVLGRLPNTRVIMVSYGADLASKNSRSVRDLIMGTKYQAVFGKLSSRDEPVELSADSRSVAAWDLASPHRGGIVAAGVGGGITGLGADLLIGDDLFKNREEAESESRRDLVDDWWKSSAMTRLEGSHAAVVLFFTHWHSDDLVGRQLRRMAEDKRNDQWEIIMLPALALESYAVDVEEQKSKMLDGVYLPLADALGRKAGEPLWPDRFSREWLESRKVNSGPYEFEALYQQMPYSKEGQRYKREWFKRVTKLPDGVTLKNIVRFWDKANSSKGDYTAGALMAYGSDGYFYLMDMKRGQWTSYERDRKMRETAENDMELGAVQIWHQQDPGSAGKDSAEATNRLLMGFPARFEPVTGDKATRSEPLESAFQGGLVFLLQGAWNDAYIEESISFDRGRYDDQVDAASSAYNKLLELIRRKPMKEVKSYQG